MTEETRTLANMEVVLDEHCQKLPHGGDHNYRRFLAERMREAASAGHARLSDLHAAARRAENEYNKKSA